MTLQQLKYIVEVSKCESISKAAQSLCLTQPTLSKAIKDLEEELGIVILERADRKTRFTAEGTELLCLARQLLEQSSMITNRFQGANGKKKQLAISAQHYTFTVKAFIDLLNEETAENFEFYFRECKTHEIIEDVYNKKSDLGIIFLSDDTARYINRLLQAKGMEFKDLKSFTSHVLIRKGHPLAKNTTIALEELEEYTFVSYEPDTNHLNFAEETISPKNIKRIVYVRDRATLMNILSNTDGYNIGTGCLIDEVVNQNIVTLPVSGHSEKMVVGWIKLKDVKLSDEICDYIKKVTKALSESYTGAYRGGKTD